MKSYRLTESKLRGIIREAVKNALCENGLDSLSNTQIRNITGISDDDELNAACDTERKEELMSKVWRSIDRLAGDRREKYPLKVNFNELCNVLGRKFGFKYDSSDIDNGSYIFVNEQGDELWLAVNWAYDRPGETILITNMGIY